MSKRKQKSNIRIYTAIESCPTTIATLNCLSHLAFVNLQATLLYATICPRISMIADSYNLVNEPGN